MATVILLHSALGLTRHVHDWADALRSEGHHVETPDLFGGQTFGDPDTAVTFADGEGGPPAFVNAALAQIRDTDGPVVYAGFSFGACVAQLLAMRRDDAAGLVMISGLIAPHWLDGEEWPAGLPAQLHRTAGDEWVSEEEAQALLAFAGGDCEDFVYPGDGHLFAFEGWPEYDADSSHRLYERVNDFLGTID
jgi:dienelactone hydrolase